MRDRGHEPEFTRCPVCSYLMIVNNHRRPIELICPKCKTGVLVSEGKDGPVAEGSRSKGPLRIRCPRCKEPLEITSDKRPLKVKCQNCGAEGSIKGYDRMSLERSRSPIGKGGHGPQGPKVIKCARCGEGILIKTDVRPLVVTCPRCRALGKLSK